MDFWQFLYRMKADPDSNIVKVAAGVNVKHSIDVQRGYKPAKGVIKALEKLLRDPLIKGWRIGILLDSDGNYWSRSVNHDISRQEELIVRFNPENEEVGMAILDSTGSLRAYDEPQRCPYEALFTLLAYFWDQGGINWNGSGNRLSWNTAKEDWKSTFDNFMKNKVIEDDKSTGYILSALYYAGKDLFPGDMDDFEEIRNLPEYGREIGKEMFDGKELCSFLDAPSDAQTTSSVLSNNKTSLEQLLDLRAEIDPVVSGFVSTLSEESKDAVPKEAHVQDYIPTQEFVDVCRFIADNISRGKMYNNILFWGPPGNGKSAFAKALSFVFQMPYRFEQGFGSKDAGDYSGTTIATNGVLNTSVETAFVKAMRDGGVFADDDFNYAKESEQTFKNSILEAPFIAKLANQTEIHRSPFAIYIATANPDCHGARAIPEAFKNRCYIDMHWKPLSDDLLVKHMEAEADYHDISVLRKMVECYHAINNAIGTGMDKKEEANNITPRNLVFWANQTRVLGGDAIRAAEYNLIGALGSDASEQFISQVRNNMIKPRFKR